MRKIAFPVLAFVLLIGPSLAWGQLGEDLYIYGYMQSLFYQRDSNFRSFPDGRTITDTTSLKTRNRTFALQQLNLFLNKPLGERSTVFVNLEFQTSYSSTIGSGEFNLQEGWFNYGFSDAAHLKLGLLLPIFNNLNEIQNRLPLFPYIIRPPVYEVLLAPQFEPEDLLPERAFVQFTGALPLQDLRLEYAVHLGNSETSFLDTSATLSTDERGGASFNVFRGEDISSFKAIGGRLGVRSGNEQLKFGVSTTYDKDNRRQVTARSISRLPGVNIPALGDVPRVRLGADLSLYLGDFFLEGEYIKVLHDLSDTAFPNISLDKQFYYLYGAYESINRWFVYAGYSYINNEAYEASQPNSVDKAGVRGATAGGGYRISYQATAKLQYQRFIVGDNPHTDGNISFLLAALSLTF